MLIGELSMRSGFSRDTIRYYEKLSLLTANHRDSENQYKNYGEEAVDRLRHIQHPHNVAHAKLPAPQQIQNAQPRPIRKRPEHPIDRYF